MVATIENRTLAGKSFHKLPGAQGATENCVAHNGMIIPVPGRDLMVQAWYQGGISIMEFTDPARPVEIAFFDRGPIDASRLYVGGSWSAYWFNGRIYSSEIARGLDVLRLVPSEHLSAAEIAAAEAVSAETINPQTQTRIVWADTPDVAASYLDQLTRVGGVEAGLAGQVQARIDTWRRGRADKRASAELSTALAAAASSATGLNATRLKALADLFGRRGR
jgi:hypothetical protein